MLVSIAAILRDPSDAEPPVSDERKATFYAAAELNVRCPFLELSLNINDRNTRESKFRLLYTPH